MAKKQSVEVRGKQCAGRGNPSLQGGVAPTAWIILPPRLEETFLEQWRSALSENKDLHEKMRNFDAHWEYDVAVPDLNRNRSPFCQEYENFARFYFRFFLWRELRAYGNHLNRVVKINRALRSFSKNLSAANTEALSAAARAGLQQSLGPLFDQLFDLRLRILKFEKDYWDRVLCVGSFASTYEQGWDDDIRKFPKMRPISESICFPLLEQERNLDTTFQIRVGDLLREYGTNPYGNRLSLLTISRLVLLVYICADLATDIDDHLIIWGSNPHRKLTVYRTYETLRNAGLR